MRTKERFSILGLFLMVCATFWPGDAFGQAVYGSIFGTVTDASGAAVPGATVTITNIGTNVSETSKTNSDGNYNQTRLIPGTYKIKVEASNFKAAVIDAVVVN